MKILFSQIGVKTYFNFGELASLGDFPTKCGGNRVQKTRFLNVFPYFSLFRKRKKIVFSNVYAFLHFKGTME